MPEFLVFEALQDRHTALAASGRPQKDDARTFFEAALNTPARIAGAYVRPAERDTDAPPQKSGKLVHVAEGSGKHIPHIHASKTAA